jgi:hypothetical protein
MNLVKHKDGEFTKYTLEKLRNDYPETSFPKVPDSDFLAKYDIYQYHDITVVPTPEGYYLGDGYFRVLLGDYVYSRELLEDPTYIDRLASEARTKRNQLLSETDWWAVIDRTMTPEQTDYRRLLRDISSQENFPKKIEWPTKPE